jgi:hypothetical protein
MRAFLLALACPLVAACSSPHDSPRLTPPSPPLDDSPHGRAVVSLRAGDRGTDVAVAPDGGIAITGSVGSYSDLVGGPVGSTDAFVARFDGGGHKIWAKRIGGTEADFGLGVAVDRDGNVIALGTIYGLVDLGGGPIGSEVGQSFYLAKYDPSGVHQWSRALPAGERVAVDRAGNIVLLGTFRRTINLGAGPLVSKGEGDVVLARFAPDGKLLGNVALGDVGDETARALSVDLAGNAVVVSTTPSVTSLVSVTTHIDVVDASFATLWTRRLSARAMFPRSIGCDGARDLTLDATFSGSLTLDTGETLASVDQRTVLLRLSHDGAHVWHRLLGSAGTSTQGVAAIDSDGSFTMMGSFRGTLDLGDRVVSTFGDSAFVARFGSDGATLWSRAHGANARVDAHAVVSDGTGFSWAIGEHYDPIDFGMGPLLPSLPSSAFLVKLTP